MLILKPEENVARVRDLARLMSKTHSKDALKDFKEIVCTAYLKQLDLSIPYYAHSSKRRQKFKDHVLRSDRMLCHYATQWPVDAYAQLWEKTARRRSQRQKGQVTATPSNSHINNTTGSNANHTRNDEDSSTDIEPRPRIVTFIGKPPPSVITRKESAAKRRAQSIAPSPSQSSSSSPIPPICHTIPTASLSAQSRTAGGADRKESHPSPCAICGYLPPIPEDIRVNLRQQFSDAVHVIPNLAKSGLIHDHHLRLLLSLSEQARLEFCDRLPRNNFSALDLATIADRLVNSTSSKGMNHPGIGSMPDELQIGYERADTVFQWPDDETQQALKTAPDILSVLKRATGLDTEPAFFSRIIELSHRHGKKFIDRYKPYSQASAEMLRSAVVLVLKDEPRLCSYEDAWPVRYYLLWCARGTRTLAPGTNHHSTRKPLIDILQAKAPTIVEHPRTDDDASYTTQSHFCPIHIPPDLNRVSETIRTFFARSGMEELVVPLALNGVTTEQQFTLFHDDVKVLVVC
ncbi:hypothetical protein D9756_001409 [Leucocoprinus leucothites]|uniref:Uncharacterized protein n=1 Tax=Leucocoprinus leucothites TaxID=201217 RepID=A0A8H5G4P3_9AGAR|nr:hypothetical protein D9756_001409 [Leucoagaricus leucothites]